MPIQIDAAYCMANAKEKHQKEKILSEMINFLNGSCYVCWAKKGELIPKTTDHKPFIHCHQSEDPKFVDNATGWWQMKKQIQLGKYEYCFQCGLPQAKYMPSGHPPFRKGQPMACPFEDIVAILTWFVFMDPPIYEKACTAFHGLRPRMTIEDFTSWAKREEGLGSFYNALELVIWLWNQKKP